MSRLSDERQITTSSNEYNSSFNDVIDLSMINTLNNRQHINFGNTDEEIRLHRNNKQQENSILINSFHSLSSSSPSNMEALRIDIGGENCATFMGSDSSSSTSSTSSSSNIKKKHNNNMKETNHVVSQRKISVNLKKSRLLGGELVSSIQQQQQQQQINNNNKVTEENQLNQQQQQQPQSQRELLQRQQQHHHHHHHHNNNHYNQANTSFLNLQKRYMTSPSSTQEGAHNTISLANNLMPTSLLSQIGASPLMSSSVAAASTAAAAAASAAAVSMLLGSSNNQQGAIFNHHQSRGLSPTTTTTTTNTTNTNTTTASTATATAIEHTLTAKLESTRRLSSSFQNTPGRFISDNRDRRDSINNNNNDNNNCSFVSFGNTNSALQAFSHQLQQEAGQFGAQSLVDRALDDDDQVLLFGRQQQQQQQQLTCKPLRKKFRPDWQQLEQQLAVGVAYQHQHQQQPADTADLLSKSLIQSDKTNLLDDFDTELIKERQQQQQQQQQLFSEYLNFHHYQRQQLQQQQQQQPRQLQAHYPGSSSPMFLVPTIRPTRSSFSSSSVAAQMMQLFNGFGHDQAVPVECCSDVIDEMSGLTKRSTSEPIVTTANDHRAATAYILATMQSQNNNNNNNNRLQHINNANRSQSSTYSSAPIGEQPLIQQTGLMGGGGGGAAANNAIILGGAPNNSNSINNNNNNRTTYRCHVCGSGFEDRHRLQQHLSIHLNLHPSWYEEKTIKETMARYESKRGDYLCTNCQLRFETTAEFDRHMQLHGDKPHHCELCIQDNKMVAFRFYRQLLTHLRSHCFLYSCRFVPDCKQTSNRKDYLKLHILKHHLNNKLPEQYTICCH